MTAARRPKSFQPHGNALGPVIVILVALAMSAAIFFFFTKKLISPDEAPEGPAGDSASTPAASPSPLPAPLPGAPGSPLPAPAPAAPKKLGFARPTDVGQQLAREMGKGDMKGAAEIIAAGDSSQQGAVLSILDKLKSLGYTPGKPEQVQSLGQVDSAIRLSIPLLKADGSPSDLDLQLDVTKDSTMGWRVSKLRLPKELESLVATGPASPDQAPMINPNGGPPLAPGMSGSLIVVEQGPDALKFASDFVHALLKLDYETARKFVDEAKIPPVKLAGICIVFEEGKYALQENKPLVATVSTETSSWIIAKVKSDVYKEETEFGLELEKSGAGWEIIGLNLSRLLADNARSSALVGIPYTPLIQNPKGGESIALYFEYDQAVLHPRAQAQLKIVASILKASPQKRLKIGGHTDALGTDNYNLSLSQRRAQAVKVFFIEQGVPQVQVETVGFGKAIPLSPNANPDGSDNPDGRSRNRRAEILLDF